jgi:hypothetical protein
MKLVALVQVVPRSRKVEFFFFFLICSVTLSVSGLYSVYGRIINECSPVTNLPCHRWEHQTETHFV